jgi:hypothetical protein
MNEIVRPLAHGLGFDARGQLWASWEENGSTKATIVPDLREKICSICGLGWELSGKSFADTTQIGIIHEHCHRKCFHGHVGLKEAEAWHDALCQARNSLRKPMSWEWKKIPNEYGGGYPTPWYLVSFAGPFNGATQVAPAYLPKLKLGRRWRVDHLSLHDITEEQVKAAEKTFDAEETTKWAGNGQAGIHAHTSEKTLEYTAALLRIIQMDDPIVREPGITVDLQCQKT